MNSFTLTFESEKGFRHEARRFNERLKAEEECAPGSTETTVRDTTTTLNLLRGSEFDLGRMRTGVHRDGSTKYHKLYHDYYKPYARLLTWAECEQVSTERRQDTIQHIQSMILTAIVTLPVLSCPVRENVNALWAKETSRRNPIPPQGF